MSLNASVFVLWLVTLGLISAILPQVNADISVRSCQDASPEYPGMVYRTRNYDCMNWCQQLSGSNEKNFRFIQDGKHTGGNDQCCCIYDTAAPKGFDSDQFDKKMNSIQSRFIAGNDRQESKSNNAVAEDKEYSDEISGTADLNQCYQKPIIDCKQLEHDIPVDPYVRGQIGSSRYEKICNYLGEPAGQPKTVVQVLHLINLLGELREVYNFNQDAITYAILVNPIVTELEQLRPYLEDVAQETRFIIGNDAEAVNDKAFCTSHSMDKSSPDSQTFRRVIFEMKHKNNSLINCLSGVYLRQLETLCSSEIKHVRQATSAEIEEKRAFTKEKEPAQNIIRVTKPRVRPSVFVPSLSTKVARSQSRKQESKLRPLKALSQSGDAFFTSSDPEDLSDNEMQTDGQSTFGQRIVFKRNRKEN